MVYHMVQEKHQDKLKTTIIQFIMLTYFLSVIMKDPVAYASTVRQCTRHACAAIAGKQTSMKEVKLHNGTQHCVMMG